MTLQEKIKEIRVSNGLTQMEFAEILDVSLDVVKNIEYGRSIVQIDLLIKICKIFNCSSDYILGLEGDSNGS